MKDFELTMRIRNNRLKERRLAMGLSAPAFAEQAGVSYTAYIQLEGLKLHPMRLRRPWREGGLEWRPVALKVAEFHRVLPEELWPDAILAVQKSEVVAKVESEMLLAATKLSADAHVLCEATSQSELEERERRDVLLRMMKRCLTPREETVLRKRFGWDDDSPMTLADIGDLDGVCGNRVKQIEAKAIRKMRKEIERAERGVEFDRDGRLFKVPVCEIR